MIVSRSGFISLLVGMVLWLPAMFLAGPFRLLAAVLFGFGLGALTILSALMWLEPSKRWWHSEP